MKNWNLFTGIGLALLGLLVIIFPTFWFKVVVILLGLGAIAYGIYSIKITKAIFDDKAYNLSIMIKSIVSIVVGVCAVAFPLSIGNAAWSVMIWVLIIDLIISAVLGFYAAALLKKSTVDRKKYFLENLGLLAVAIFLVILSPSGLARVIFRIVGVIAIVVGAVIILIEVLARKNTVVVKNEDIEVKDESTDAHNGNESSASVSDSDSQL